MLVYQGVNLRFIGYASCDPQPRGAAGGSWDGPHRRTENLAAHGRRRGPTAQQETESGGAVGVPAQRCGM